MPSYTTQHRHFLFMVLITGLLGSGMLLGGKGSLDRVSYPHKRTPASPASPIDLNRAPESELLQLPAVSPEMARHLIATRGRVPIRSLRELLTLPGFDRFVLSRIQPWLAELETAPTPAARRRRVRPTPRPSPTSAS